MSGASAVKSVRKICFDFYVKENRQKKKDFVITQIEDGQKRDPFWGVRASKYLGLAWVG